MERQILLKLPKRPWKSKMTKKIIRYKLTDQKMETYNRTQWEIGEWKQTSGDGELCGPGWLHCYSNPLLAAFLNPIHASFANPRLFEAEVKGNTRKDHGLKEGWNNMRLTKELVITYPTLQQYVKFGILCALAVPHEEQFALWAENWLNNINRTPAAAKSVRQTFQDNGPQADAMYWATWAAEDIVDSPTNVPHEVANAAECVVANIPKGKKINLAKLAKKAMEQ
jgi:hypothetical protein